MKKVNLNNRIVGDGEPVYIVAEGGVTNFGDLSLAKKQVDAAMAAGCDAVKFQAQTTEALISKKVALDWYKRMKYKELSYAQLKDLWNYCSILNIQCFMTAHTDVDLDFLDKELNVPFFKVGSGESVNYEFLKNVGRRGKPVIMSLGMHLNENEIRKSVGALEDAGASEIVIMHCNTVYPTPPEVNHLKMISRLKEMFDYPIGYSDHSVGLHMAIAAVALGACMIEKHISFDLRDLRSLDCAGSATPEMWKNLVQQIREVEAAMEQPPASREEKIMQGRTWAQQSIVAKADIPMGNVITHEMLAFKRPGKGLPPYEAEKIIGRTAKRGIGEDELILETDVI